MIKTTSNIIFSLYFIFVVTTLSGSIVNGSTCSQLFGRPHESESIASTLMTDLFLQNLQIPIQLDPVGANPLVPENRPAVEMILSESLKHRDNHIAEMARITIANNFRQSDVIALVTEFVFSKLVESAKNDPTTWGEGWGRDDFENRLPSKGNLENLSYRDDLADPFWIPFTPRILFYSANDGMFNVRQTFLARSLNLVLVGLPTKVHTIHSTKTIPWENIYHHDWGGHASRRFWGDLSLLDLQVHFSNSQGFVTDPAKVERIDYYSSLVDFEKLNGSVTPQQREFYRQTLERAMERERKITLSLDSDIQLLTIQTPELSEHIYLLLNYTTYEAVADLTLKRRALPVSMALEFMKEAPTGYITATLDLSEVISDNPETKLNPVVLGQAKDWLAHWWIENKDRSFAGP